MKIAGIIRNTTLLLITLLSTAALAGESEFGVTGGFRTNNMDTNVLGNSVSGQK